MIAIDKAKAYLATVTAPGGEYHARHIIKEMINELEAACTWTESVGGYWATDCGESFEIHEGGPDENGLRYCCFCGRQLIERSHRAGTEQRIINDADARARLERLVMLGEIVEVLRYEWQKCQFEWGIEKYVTIQSEHAGRLILMQVERFSGATTTDGHPICGIRATPVLHADLADLNAADLERELG